ncbi:MAG: ATP-binding cassette domain-containing protein [Trichococcus flocculiformis]
MSAGNCFRSLFVTENYEFDRYQEANKQMIRLNIKESMAGKWFRVVINVFTNIGPMLIYLVGGILIIEYGNTDLTIGDITVMVALLGRMYGPVNSLLNIQVDMIRSMALFDRIFEYFDLPVEIDNDPQALRPESFAGELAFEEVSFHYDPDQPILNNVSFELKPGSSVAIVGPSGAGKSTIINLIPRLYDVTGGRILIGRRRHPQTRSGLSTPAHRRGDAGHVFVQRYDKRKSALRQARCHAGRNRASVQ